MKKTGQIRRKWYEKYLPFIARSPRMQIDWLSAAFRKGNLTLEEMTPYLRLFLERDDEEGVRKELLRDLDAEVLTDMLRAADVHDTPRLLRLLPSLSPAQVRIALEKEPPPYESAPELARHRIFQAVHERSEEQLVQTATALIQGQRVSADFVRAYERFREVLKDEEILSALYPKARF